jgi:hypothetical protein
MAVALILSIDLACKSYEEFGFCLLEELDGRVKDIRYPPYQDIGLQEIPKPDVFACKVLNYCQYVGASILMLDGPQGWKDPDNSLLHQRICEKRWNTQAKTGTKGNVKPANFRPFVSFSTEVFRLLAQGNMISLVTEPIIEISPQRILLVETYPYSAWKSLKVDPLPGKRNPSCNSDKIASVAKTLEQSLLLPSVGKPSHDELSALVAGVAGVAIAAKDESRYIALGTAPKWTPEGYLLEGYIVNPR